MNEPIIRTSLSLPGEAPFPSANTIQWTEDGQLIVVTKNKIFILSPASGIQTDPTALVKQEIPDGIVSDRYNVVQWVRTIVEWETIGELRQWPVENQDWGSVSLGSLDPGFRSVTCSPSNLGIYSSCVYAVLTSALQVSVWGPVKNQLTGKWIKIADLSDIGFNPAPTVPNPALFKILQAQVASTSWSTQADFLLSPMPVVDASLLAVGSRAGVVSFVRFIGNTNENMLRHVTSLSVGDRWIVQLAWSTWTSSQPGHCRAYVACCTSDRHVKIVEVTQVLQQQPSPFSASFGIAVECKLLGDPSFPQLPKVITSMKWIQAQRDTPILVFGTSGEIHIWTYEADSSALSGCHTIALQTQSISAGATCFAPMSGITYNRHYDTLIISLTDGSFHLVSHLSTGPVLGNLTAEADFTAGTISANARSVFFRLEDSNVGRVDVNRIDGMTSYDDGSTYAWIHEHTRPTDFDYKHDAKHVSSFVVAELWQEATDESVLTGLEHLTSSIKVSTSKTPLAHLRPFLFRLDDPETIIRIRDRLLHILSRPSAEVSNLGLSFSLSLYTGELSTQVRDEFTRSLRIHLFGWDSVFRLRVKLLVATFCKSRVIPEVQGQLDAIIASVATAIRFRVLLVILRHIQAMLSHISEREILFVLRCIVQALTIPELANDAQQILTTLKSAVPNTNLDALNPSEPCPACHALVPFTDPNLATCSNGHKWQRCSITSFILSTPMVRTCLGCSRKAYLSSRQSVVPASGLHNAGSNWLVEDLLDAVRRCLYCGNNFVTLV
ncbi:hypothetical protein QCA50_009008 [Cerrena zonata]|uniref:Transcription factor IIIC 90kDa subunit N-terminal domain-containing protein n=1 Tax=Cerrena zonata TaxID=2478898 RepID=A0AAW0GCC7_9APHY